MMRFDLTDLRLLIAIVEAGSLSKAAATFPIALSAASNRLRQLEHRTGLTLFTRHADGMTLTPAGRVAVDQARRVMGEAAQLNQALDGLAGRARVQMRLSANTVANSTFLPPALGPFLADYPEVDLQIDEQSSEGILHALIAGEIDIGILDGNLPLDGIVSLPFRHDRLVLLVPHAHPLATRTHCLFQESLSYPFVGMLAERAMQVFIEKMAILHGTPLTVRVRAPGFTAIAQLVGQGVGIAVLPEAAAIRHNETLPTSVVRLDDPWTTRELRLCVRNLETLPPLARQLVVYLTGIK